MTRNTNLKLLQQRGEFAVGMLALQLRSVFGIQDEQVSAALDELKNVMSELKAVKDELSGIARQMRTLRTA